MIAHPNQFCPRFQVFGVYDGDDDRFVFAVQKFDEQERAERVARKLMEVHGRIISGGWWGEAEVSRTMTS